MTASSASSFGSSHQHRLQAALDRFLPSETQEPGRLHQALRYSVLQGGKRLRPILVYSVGEALGISLDILDYPAAALEMVHSFSLIHDDLPALDNDDLRRGRPACHRQFDEATAILAGDGLYGLAFHVLTQTPQVSLQAIVNMVAFLSQLSGTQGMIGGELMDIEMERHGMSDTKISAKGVSINKIIHLIELKTACLIQCALLLPTYLSASTSQEVQQSLRQYGLCIGIAFQIQDDILDATGQHQYLGKQQYGDQRQGKFTLPLAYGIDEARSIQNRYFEDACDIIKKMPLELTDMHLFLSEIIHRAGTEK